MTDQPESSTPIPPPSATPTRAIARQATSRVAFVAEPPDEDDPLLQFAPVPHVAPRRNSITADRQRAFIAALAASGIVHQAARHIGASLEALYKLRKKPGAEGFAAAWEEALRWGGKRLEDCALERALRGEFDFDKALGWDGRANGLLLYLLALRSEFRLDERDLAPGHPVYERIRAEVIAEGLNLDGRDESLVVTPAPPCGHPR